MRKEVEGGRSQTKSAVLIMKVVNSKMGAVPTIYSVLIFGGLIIVSNTLIKGKSYEKHYCKFKS
ncbi:hypothetical protein DN068_07575 [Taibaiella soli]|uniref:Uncharacterized protein n=1 Tax=Taibaiella soli TaxID=1649169 RepID=A0A2W2C0H7_9BACT|nr:hypothetical protein DN068_07575 [Taibaiella soli]